MKVTFEITLKDMWKQMWWLRWHMPIHRNSIIVFGLIWLWLFRGNMPVGKGSAVFFYILFVIMLYIVLQAAIYTVFFAIDLYRLTKRRGVICEHSVEITDDGLREQTEANDSFSRWESIDLIKANKKYIYYCSGYGCLGIPKRAFGSELEAEQFLQKALSLWKEHRGK
ncbi:MAG: YcxB family protein [Bacillota bacterium]